MTWNHLIKTTILIPCWFVGSNKLFLFILPSKNPCQTRKTLFLVSFCDAKSQHADQQRSYWALCCHCFSWWQRIAIHTRLYQQPSRRRLIKTVSSCTHQRALGQSYQFLEVGLHSYQKASQAVLELFCMAMAPLWKCPSESKLDRMESKANRPSSPGPSSTSSSL